jgi:hypothetical protein
VQISFLLGAQSFIEIFKKIQNETNLSSQVLITEWLAEKKAAPNENHCTDEKV